MTCKFGQYWLEGSDCIRGKEVCPHGYEKKPDTGKVDVMTDAPPLEKDTVPSELLRGHSHSLRGPTTTVDPRIGTKESGTCPFCGGDLAFTSLFYDGFDPMECFACGKTGAEIMEKIFRFWKE